MSDDGEGPWCPECGEEFGTTDDERRRMREHVDDHWKATNGS